MVSFYDEVDLIVGKRNKAKQLTLNSLNGVEFYCEHFLV